MVTRIPSHKGRAVIEIEGEDLLGRLRDIANGGGSIGGVLELIRMLQVTEVPEELADSPIARVLAEIDSYGLEQELLGLVGSNGRAFLVGKNDGAAYPRLLLQKWRSCGSAHCDRVRRLFSIALVAASAYDDGSG